MMAYKKIYILLILSCFSIFSFAQKKKYIAPKRQPPPETRFHRQIQSTGFRKQSLIPFENAKVDEITKQYYHFPREKLQSVDSLANGWFFQKDTLYFSLNNQTAIAFTINPTQFHEIQKQVATEAGRIGIVESDGRAVYFWEALGVEYRLQAIYDPWRICIGLPYRPAMVMISNREDKIEFPHGFSGTEAWWKWLE
ncbi:MAG: hypothetical protein NZ108_04400 [Bacteroidia bacterium]|nr:hypothetical protein [Bacteroidia bacterium]